MDDPRSTTAPAWIPDLLTFLISARETANRLAELLDREYEALVTWNADTVIEIATAKQSLLGELEAQHQAWEAHLAQQNIPPGTGSISRLIQTAGARAPALTRAWGEFRAALQRLRQANRINCELVGSATRQTQQLLTLLQGETATPLYGPGARLATPTATRIRDEI